MKRLKHFFIGNKYGLSLIVIAFAIAVCLLTGTTYGLWRLNFTQTDSNVVSTACFDMTFTELTPSVNLQNIYPISDEQGLETIPYTFKIANTCTQYGTYAIRLDILNTSTMSADKIKVQLEGVSSMSPTVLSTLETNSILEPGISSSKIIVSDSLYEQEEKEYSLRIWIDASAGNEVMNQEFNGRLTIDTVATELPGFLASESLSNPTGTDVFWGGTLARDTVETISFTTTNEVPAEAIGSWDVSEEHDGKVMAWYKDVNANSRYEIYVGAKGGVYAPENSSSLFHNFRYLNSLNLTNFNTSRTTNMEAMFSNAGGFSTAFTLDLGDKFDTSNVTNMSYMFSSTGSINIQYFILDLGDKFDTSKVTDMQSMFAYIGQNCPYILLDLGDKFDTSNVTDMNGMFAYAGHISASLTLDLGDKFDTSKVTNMNAMFDYTGWAVSDFVLDLRNFNVGSVTATNSSTLATGNTSHKIYASNSNIDFMSDTGKGFTGTIINCTTSPASCP